MKREDAERLVDEAILRANRQPNGVSLMQHLRTDCRPKERDELAAAILAAVAERDRAWRAALSEFAKTYHMDTLPWCIEDFSEGWPDRQPEEPAR